MYTAHTYRQDMRVLRFVGPGADSSHVVVETVDGGEQFSLHVGDQLRSATQSDLPRLLSSAPPAELSLPPREIQVRVRSGESPEAIAHGANLPVERVMRFARPVLEERTRITVEARRSRARQSTPDGHLVGFGESVDARFTAHGIDPTAVSWDAYRREDGQWVVSAGWRGGDAARIARWAFALAHRTVSPLDETAADLLSDRPIRPVVQAVPDSPPAEDEFTRPLPQPHLLDDLFDQEAADARAATEQPSPSEPPAEPAEPPADQPLPLRLAEPGEHRAHHSRPKVPAWDDIMLGVRRKSD